jgi:hypothetical protein
MTEHHSELIPCRDAVRQLWNYLDKTVRPDEHAKLEEHLSFCRRCCGELEFVKNLRDLLASQQADEFSPVVIQRLERFVEEL